MNEFTGKTIDDAIEEGLKELGLTKEQVEVEVLEEPQKKLFGSKKALVRVTPKSTDGTRATKFLDNLFSLMNVQVATELHEDEDNITINLLTMNSASVIGYRGEVLDALQCLAGAVANTGREDYRRVVVNCEGYREKREETLKSLAGKLADKAIRTGRKVSLEPMNPFERRVIHASLSENEEVETHSEGKEPNRYVVIVPKNLKSYQGGKKGGRDFKGRRNDRSNDRPAPKKTTGWGGTFLGNSLKDGENQDNE